MKYIYRLPYDYRKAIEKFQVIRWSKREAILEDEHGKRIRITPSDYDRFKKSPEECLACEFTRLKHRQTCLIRDLEKTEKSLKMLDQKIHYVTMKTIYEKTERVAKA